MDLYLATKDLHHQAEQHPFAQKLLAATVEDQAWHRWVYNMMLLHQIVDSTLPTALHRGYQLTQDWFAGGARVFKTPTVDGLRPQTQNYFARRGVGYIVAASHVRGGVVIRKRLKDRQLPMTHLFFAEPKEADEAVKQLRKAVELESWARLGFSSIISIMNEIEEGTKHGT